MRLDFLRFEGNAQTLRLLTKLQIINDDYGLNLSYATLAALIKYPVAADGVDKSLAIHRKPVSYTHLTLPTKRIV